MNTQHKHPASNILGVTGLSRRADAGYFRHAGLFGRDSCLSRAQQAAIYSRLPAIEGLRVPVVNLQPAASLCAVAELTGSAVAGVDLENAKTLARSRGVSQQAIAEICTVVANVLLVFGPFPQPGEKLAVTPNDLSKAA